MALARQGGKDLGRVFVKQGFLAAMHDPVSPVLAQPCAIGWDAKERQVDLVISRPLTGKELLSKMKGWVTVDVREAERVISAHGRLKLLDDRVLVVECEDPEDLAALQEELVKSFGNQADLEPI